MADKKKNALSPDSAKILLLLIIPIIGIGGTAAVSIIRMFSLREILLNTAISAALCIVAEIPLKYSVFEKEGSGWIVIGYISGLLMSLSSAFLMEFMLPLAAPAVLIAFLSGAFNGAAALLLFVGISFLVLYESSVYFFYVMVSGFVLLVMFAEQKNAPRLTAALTFFSVSIVTYFSCFFLMGLELSPELAVFPLVGMFLNFLTVSIIRPKLIENVILKKELFYRKVIDTEYELMQTLKNENRREYDIAVHTAHFCDILTEKMNSDRRKCLGICYYNSIGVLRGDRGNIPEKSLSMIREREFPPDIIEGIKEYYAMNNLRLSKESALVLIIRRVISDIYLFIDSNRGKRPVYNNIITTVMREMTGNPRILKSDLSLNDLNLISEKLRGEALYYDFLL